MSQESDLNQILAAINNKLSSSTALNGGFDLLAANVSNIKNSQEEMKEKINNLHDVVYDPDTGIYSKIKNLEHKNQLESLEIRNDLAKIHEFNHVREQKRIQKEKFDLENKKLLEESVKKIEEITNWKKVTFNFAKWILTSGVLGSILKFLYIQIFHH